VPQFQLQQQKRNKKENLGKKMKNKKVAPRNKILDAKGLLCVTTCHIRSKKSRAWGIFWPLSKQ
jgi:hypothetical protein